MMYRVLLAGMLVIAVAAAFVGFSYSPDGTGLFGGFGLGVMLDLLIGFVIALVLALIRVVAGTEMRTHRHAG